MKERYHPLRHCWSYVDGICSAAGRESVCVCVCVCVCMCMCVCMHVHVRICMCMGTEDGHVHVHCTYMHSAYNIRSISLSARSGPYIPDLVPISLSCSTSLSTNSYVATTCIHAYMHTCTCRLVNLSGRQGLVKLLSRVRV